MTRSTPAPYAASADYDYSRPLYDSVVPPVAPAPVAAERSANAETRTYRYVYEPDRILVIDPAYRGRDTGDPALRREFGQEP